ncbi:MAG: hypothetical protein GWN71_21735, partial [Gammaproteobacteria bacterium]|nr:hypothetical protein [Gemmatimonadota bacterium]NIR35064.1 hypothetical protein [Actinomycetota bacterium]NIU76090.1 hypothetical protein [Gammaproteobacteria bacterium]NIY09941.1 hypothetical protein [Gemmatimonadota bacterium]
MEYKCSDCREIFDSFLPWRARDGEVLCGTCWRLTATPEEKLSDFDKRAAMQFQRDLRKVDYAGIAVPPPADQRKLDVGAADLRREALGFPAARTGGRAAEIAKKRCAPSPFDKSRAASLAAYVMTGDGT